MFLLINVSDGLNVFFYVNHADSFIYLFIYLFIFEKKTYVYLVLTSITHNMARVKALFWN